MAITAGTLALIGLGVAAAGATAGAIGSSVKNKEAREERTRMYNQSRDFLNSEYYRDPLSTIGNRSLLKSAKKAYKDNLDAIDNRMVAGGATMENQLAARQANNEGLDRLYGNLLQTVDARRNAINQQRLQLDQNYSAGVQASLLQDAQNWQSWGSQIGQAGMSLASSGLLDDPNKVIFNFKK